MPGATLPYSQTVAALRGSLRDDKIGSIADVLANRQLTNTGSWPEGEHVQVTCFAFNWDEVRKRPTVDAVVDEMIHSDDIDTYATYLPEDIWGGDSAMLHFAVASALSEVVSSPDASLFPGVAVAAQLISDGESIDELGLSPLTEGTYFVSLSPERVAQLSQTFSLLPIDALAARCCQAAEWPAEDIATWLRQWRGALAFAKAKGLGLLGHCG